MRAGARMTKTTGDIREMPAQSTAEQRAPYAPAELQAILAGHERYVLGRGGVRASFKGALLDGVDLSNRKLDEADFTGASLTGVNLNGASLTRASLYCANLRRTTLQHARLEQADLRGASFRGADLSHAVLDNADLRAAKMMLVGEAGVSVVNHGKDDSVFGGVDFSNCSLRHSSFGKAKLDGAIFDGAMLVGTNFRGARLTNASFTGAVLMGVNMQDLDLPREAFAGCIFDISPQARAKAQGLAEAISQHHRWVSSNGADGSVACLDGEDLRPLMGHFQGRNLAGLSARGAIAIGLDFSKSQLQGTKFDGADLRGANFSDTDLSGVSFHVARLAHARFTSARLSNLHLRHGETLAPNFLGADATPEQFADAVLEESLAALGLSGGVEVEL